VQGLIGAMVGVGAVWGLQKLLTNVIPASTSSSLWRGWYVGPSDALQISVIVLLLGAGIGTAGAIVGLRRFLDV